MLRTCPSRIRTNFVGSLQHSESILPFLILIHKLQYSLSMIHQSRNLYNFARTVFVLNINNLPNTTSLICLFHIFVNFESFLIEFWEISL